MQLPWLWSAKRVFRFEENSTVPALGCPCHLGMQSPGWISWITSLSHRRLQLSCLFTNEFFRKNIWKIMKIERAPPWSPALWQKLSKVSNCLRSLEDRDLSSPRDKHTLWKDKKKLAAKGCERSEPISTMPFTDFFLKKLQLPNSLSMPLCFASFASFCKFLQVWKTVKITRDKR